MNNNKNAIYLITGGAGFIGSNFIRYLFKTYGENIRVINIDKLTYAGNSANLSDIERDFTNNYTFIKGDITDDMVLSDVFSQYAPDIIVNFAAESHVDRSIIAPESFIKTNIYGTFKLLEYFKKSYYSTSNWTSNKLFIQISTDEVYGEIKGTCSFSEISPLCPSSPYAASKASADLLVYSYFRTYHAPVIITRSSNNYGPYQHPEKFIPLVISNCLQKRSIPIYGRGENIRDWLYVKDNIKAIALIINKGKTGNIYNIGGRNEISNLELAKIIIKLVREFTDFDINNDLIKFVRDRMGHDFRYSVSIDKIKNELGWNPERDFSNKLKETVRWYINNKDWLNKINNNEYKSYYNKTYGKI